MLIGAPKARHLCLPTWRSAWSLAPMAASSRIDRGTEPKVPVGQSCLSVRRRRDTYRPGSLRGDLTASLLWRRARRSRYFGYICMLVNYWNCTVAYNLDSIWLITTKKYQPPKKTKQNNKQSNKQTRKQTNKQTNNKQTNK